jgi:hypothetical protein
VKPVEDSRLIVSQVIPDTPLVATVDEFVQFVFPEDAPRNGDTNLPLGLKLGVEKFRLGHGRKYYRLIWTGRGEACLAAEDEEKYATKTGALESGRALAASFGIEFDEFTR